MTYLEITIPIASEWPTREELLARNTVEDALDAAGVGLCTGAGGGMGKMDLTYRVEDESFVPAALDVIAEAMKTHMPGFCKNWNSSSRKPSKTLPAMFANLL